MISLVTGATGFVGNQVVRALLDDGDGVRCLVRHTDDAVLLDGLAVERVAGDLRDPASVRRAVRGVDRVFHCAADYRLYVPDPDTMYRTNVDGTRHVMEAAWSFGIRRVVHTSSVGALGLRADGRPADESAPVGLDDMIGTYKRTKFLAERVAEEWAGRGLPVVIVNPTAPVGDGDVRPTATGRMILDFLRRRMPAYLDTGLNFVDVRDVARGHVLAAERGRVGQRYILGNRNLTMQQVLNLLAGITGLPAPRLRLPHWPVLAFAAIDTAISRWIGCSPRAPLDAVRMARHRMFFDGAKAVRELGMPQTPVEHALERAVRWFHDRGYVTGGNDETPARRRVETPRRYR